MRINKPLYPYIANKKDNAIKLLNIFRKNKGYPITVLNPDETIFGIISKGDLIDNITSNENVDLNHLNAETIANQYPIVGHYNDSFETIKAYLEPIAIRVLPVLNYKRRVIKIITKEEPSISFDDQLITNDSLPFLIAEIGVNHNGDIDDAKNLILDAYNSGCNAVKFQHRSSNTYSKFDINSYDLGTQYILSEIERTNLNIDQLTQCCEFAKRIGIKTIITPFDEVALEEIINAKIDLSAIKIASCDLSNFPLIKNCAETNLPLILSTGMSYERDIIKTSKYLLDLMVEHSFLHCNSTYPSPIEDANLSYISRIRSLTNVIVGFSSHEGNLNIPLSSIAHGAKILEFHITKSKNLRGTDHRASIETNELNYLVKQSKLIYQACGSPQPRKPSQGELSNKISLGKSYALNKIKKKGEIIQKEDLILISPGSGFNYDQIDKLLGKVLRVDFEPRRILKAADLIGASDISLSEVKNTIKKLKNRGFIAGIPVRYHDYEELNNIFRSQIVEFHMSDRDLNLNPSNYLKNKNFETELIVHSVEQFEDGFIFDLASQNDEIIKRSLLEFERLIKHIDKLRLFFKDKAKIKIILNLGGFTNDNFLDEKNYKISLDKCIKNLNKINKKFENYNILPQTMPPFPWHQGGRSYHNILTSLKRIKDFLNVTENDICLDISHTALSCFFFEENIIEHLNAIGSRISHIHLSDAQGQNSEGLEVGSGTLDFKSINQTLLSHKKDFTMIPEIWQGHLQQGEPFARSLKRFLDLTD